MKTVDDAVTLGGILKTPEPPPLKPFTFRIAGHGHDLPVNTYEAEDEHKAFKMAFADCKHFELPGWRLVCTTTGTSQAVAEFIDRSETNKRGTYLRRRA